MRPPLSRGAGLDVGREGCLDTHSIFKAAVVFTNILLKVLSKRFALVHRYCEGEVDLKLTQLNVSAFILVYRLMYI